MRISINWLKEFVDIPVGVRELAEHMTMLGLEVESVERPGDEIDRVYAGRIVSIESHPDADKLVVCKTDVGGEAPLQIVCGAKNMNEGDVVPTALIGATLPGGFEIRKRKMRGVESQGMMCSPKELGLGEDHSGLMILPEDTPLGQDCVELLGLDDAVIEIEVIPNRGDWAGMAGVAREVAALYGVDTRLPEAPIAESGAPASEISSVTIENAALCPRYCGRVLSDVQLGPSPPWLAQRLVAAGMRPINNVVDITNYVLLETGHPLHAFDLDTLTGQRIVVRTARRGETLVTIDHEKRALTEDMLVIADAERPVALAGVMGGAETEVGEGSKRVFLESAYFDPRSIRATSRAFSMASEASQRFQRGADPEMARFALERAASLMQGVCGATAHKGVLDEYPAPPQPLEVTLRYERANKLLGATIPPDTQREYLERLRFQVQSQQDTAITVQSPPWRHDIKEEADLVEEVARLYGYGTLHASLPTIRQNPDAADFAPHDKPLRRLRAMLTGTGLDEFMHMTFSSQAAVRNAGLPAGYQQMVKLENPMSENWEGMRTSLVPPILATLADNVNKGSHTVRAYETGPVYFPVYGADLPDQQERLAIALTGERLPQHWSRETEAFDFYDIKGHAEKVFDWFDQAYSFTECDLSLFAPGQGAEARDPAGERLGFLGRVSDPVRERFELEQDAFIAELDLERLLGQRPGPAQYEPVPKFPPALRDIAVVVDASTPAGQLASAAKETGKKLLRRVDVFDIYTGDPIPAGRKSVALNLVFQSPEKTLTDKDTQKAVDKIVRRLRNDFGAELR